MNLYLCPLAAIMSLALATPLSAAASPLMPQGTCNVVEVWVDPVHGTDPAPVPAGGHEVVVVNNPAAATKTIQAAIDAAGLYLRLQYDAVDNPDQQAVVHLMPGIYGPATAYNGQVGNGERFPILMHDRVHLRGVNARHCVIRGVSAADGAYGSNLSPQVFWPIDAPCAQVGYVPRQVLIDCTWTTMIYRTSPTSPAFILPWADDAAHVTTPEIIDGVTFQGGDVQVYCGTLRELPLPVFTRVSNCLFDMRDGITVEKGVNQQGTFLSGPSIGLLVAQSWVDSVNPPGGLSVSGGGYMPKEVQSLGNTFLLAEFDKTQGGGIWLRCRPGAVGLLDTCDPVCPGPSDPLQLVRGVNRIGVQNNLFRTHTALPQTQVREMAMVGIGGDDALVHDGVQFRDTNAYALARAGSASLTPGVPSESFVSPPYVTGSTGSGGVVYSFAPSITWPLVLANQPALPPQSASVKIWDGDFNATGPQMDPAFVGEYLRTVTPALPTYRDWRLLPGSPLQNKGWVGATSLFSNGASFVESACDALKLQAWDHEKFGNLRSVDGAPDIGFDEVQLGVMAGSYANHSLSHNRSGILNPLVANEQATRFLFLRQTAPGTTSPLQGRTLTLRSNEIVAGTSFRAWTEPPGSLSSPTSVSGPPAGYQFLYTSVSNPVAWMGSYSATVPAPIGLWPNWQGAPGQLPIQLTRVQFPVDDEGAGFASWVNAQPVVTATGFPALLGSMQPEFR